MIGEILGELVGEAALGRLGRAERTKALVRIVFGLVGTLLGLLGAYHVATTVETANRLLHASMVALFVFLALFALLNIAFLRRWRWPGLGFVLSFVCLFLSRIILGP